MRASTHVILSQFFPAIKVSVMVFELAELYIQFVEYKHCSEDLIAVLSVYS